MKKTEEACNREQQRLIVKRLKFGQITLESLYYVSLSSNLVYFNPCIFLVFMQIITFESNNFFLIGFDANHSL